MKRKALRIIPSVEAHAAQRLNERYGLAFTLDLKAELFARIADARANDNRSAQACRLRVDLRAERWLVSLDGRILHVVVNRGSATVATFLPLHGKRR